GPIAIFTYTRDAARQGLAAVLWLTELLSLNLAIINLFPIPILDGGRIFMIALDSVLGVIGLHLSKVAKERMMQVGFFVIVALMAVVMINDIRQHVIPAKATTHQTEAPAANK
ncbi:MAG: site-2 protease family protein, partial [Blastocatellia bacterium]